MKTTLIAAAAALFALGALPALAAEGNGDPFPLYAGSLTTTTATYSPDTGSAAYPVIAGRPGSDLGVYAGTMTPDTGSEATVQTANSLPLGAQDLARAYATLGAPVRVQTVMAQAAPRG